MPPMKCFKVLGTIHQYLARNFLGDVEDPKIQLFSHAQGLVLPMFDPRCPVLKGIPNK